MNMQTFERRESDVRGYSRTYPVVFDKASNSRQTDESGKEYIDFFAGAGVLNFGHNNERMQKAVIEYIQSNGVTHSLDMATVAKRAFIEKFEDVVLKPRNMPHKMQFMGPTGTNSVEAALKIARRVTGRQQIVSFSHGFHGMTLGSLACTANAYFRGAAGVPLQLQALAREVGALMIIDDIQVGCGRTGTYFSFDELGIDPDIVCLAKGVGGWGTPMALNLVKPEIDKHWSPGEHTGTFRGQNLSFVAGREALTYFENDELMNEVKRKAKLMHAAMQSLVKRHAQLELTGKGMILGLNVGSTELSKTIVNQCFENGLMIASCGTGGRVIKLIPPLTIPDEDLEQGLNTLIKAVNRVMEAA